MKKHSIVTRRDALVLGAGALGSVLASRPILAAADDVTFCGIYSSTGAYAAFGRDTDRGFRLALDATRGRIIGKSVRYLNRDDQTKPDAGVQQVTDAYDHDGARFFAGVASSAVALAIEQVVKDKKALFWTSVGADEVTGKDCNAYTFRWSVPTYGAVRSTMYPFLKMFPSAKKWYTITPSYVFGESLLTNVKEVAQERGLQLVGNDYHPLGATEYSAFIAKAAEAKPDVLALLNFGADAVKTIKTAVSFGLKKSMKILYVWTGGLLDFQAVGADDLEGLYLGCQYWHDSTEATRHASEPYKAAYGEPLGYVGASAYIEARLTLDGIARARSTDPLSVPKALAGYKYPGPTGPEEVRPWDHQVVKPYYLLHGKSKGKMRDQWDFCETLGVSSYPVPRGKSLCKLPA